MQDVVRLMAAGVIWALLSMPGVYGYDRPNVVLIISDDQAWSDYGFLGHRVVQTPQLDQLASQSLLFVRGYVTAPLCRPSLASIVTGLYPHQHGVVSNDVDPERRAESDTALREQFHRHPSLIRMLVESGYVAFQSGKWWEGSWKEGGFTDGMTHGDPIRGGRHGDEGLQIGRTTLTPVLDFMSQAVSDDKPFFLWYAPFMPHTPHNPPPEILEKYAAPGRPDNVAKYYAMCEWFDATCGELIDHLEALGVRDNTLIFYLSDNGWAPVAQDSEETTATLPEGWWPDYAPRSKGSPYELGIRTPIVLSWPAQLKSERVEDLASSIDLLPTILKACQIEPPADLPGIDLMNSEARQERDAVFGGVWSTHNAIVGQPQATLQYRWCVAGPWKLLLRDPGLDSTRYRVLHEWDTRSPQLFDLRADGAEQHNLLAEHPEVVKRLTQRIEAVIPGGEPSSAE